MMIHIREHQHIVTIELPLKTRNKIPLLSFFFKKYTPIYIQIGYIFPPGFLFLFWHPIVVIRPCSSHIKNGHLHTTHWARAAQRDYVICENTQIQILSSTVLGKKTWELTYLWLHALPPHRLLIPLFQILKFHALFLVGKQNEKKSK